MVTPNAHIQRAIELAGSQAELARKIGCSSVFVHQMARGIRSVPARLCLPIERATSGAVTRYELRPEVFGDPPASSGAEGEAARLAQPVAQQSPPTDERAA